MSADVGLPPAPPDGLRLAPPHVRFHASFLTAVDEYVAIGDLRYSGVPDLPAEGTFPGLRFTRDGLAQESEFARLVRARLDDERPETPRPFGWVPATYRWLEHADHPGEYLGQISLRHRLTPFLLEEGGHIGYTVRPGARRRGYAVAALRQMLGLAAQRGKPQVLITCDTDNTASAKVIESCGGLLDDVRHDKRRYWVPTEV